MRAWIQGVGVGVGFLIMSACTPSDVGKTIVFELDEAEPRGTLNPDTCALGVGLDVSLGFTGSISYEVAVDGSGARVGSCTLDDNGEITGCGIFQPEVLLELAEGNMVGESIVPLSIPDSDCTNVDLATEWTLTPDGDRLRTQIHSVYHLPQTEACENFETLVIQQTSSGLGIEGCELDFDFMGTRTARCSYSSQGQLLCDPVKPGG